MIKITIRLKFYNNPNIFSTANCNSIHPIHIEPVSISYRLIIEIDTRAIVAQSSLFRVIVRDKIGEQADR